MRQTLPNGFSRQGCPRQAGRRQRCARLAINADFAQVLPSLQSLMMPTSSAPHLCGACILPRNARP
jgi:hypothetical protein